VLTAPSARNPVAQFALAPSWTTACSIRHYHVTSDTECYLGNSAVRSPDTLFGLALRG
jgi:hypothetical protein